MGIEKKVIQKRYMENRKNDLFSKPSLLKHKAKISNLELHSLLTAHVSTEKLDAIINSDYM